MLWNTPDGCQSGVSFCHRSVSSQWDYLRLIFFNSSLFSLLHHSVMFIVRDNNIGISGRIVGRVSLHRERRFAVRILSFSVQSFTFVERRPWIFVFFMIRWSFFTRYPKWHWRPSYFSFPLARPGDQCMYDTSLAESDSHSLRFHFPDIMPVRFLGFP